MVKAVALRGKLTLSDKLSRLGDPSEQVVREDIGSFSRIVDITDILFEVFGYLSVPDRRRDGDGDGGSNRAPQVQDSDGDGHVLMWYRSLYGYV